ncbi:MAG: hypothetical protein ABIP61_12115, partial [Burkholderiaceae bacterium]
QHASEHRPMRDHVVQPVSGRRHDARCTMHDAPDNGQYPRRRDRARKHDIRAASDRCVDGANVAGFVHVADATMAQDIVCRMAA